MLRGDKYIVTTAGYLRQVARLPDFVGGPLFLGSWIEGGSAFDEWEHLTWSTNLSLGLIADTIIGPVFGGFSFGFEGGTRFYIAIGQLFR